VPGRAVVIETISVTATGRSAELAQAAREFAPRTGELKPMATRRVFFDGAWRETPFFAREVLHPGDLIAGPAVICERNTTVVIERRLARNIDGGGSSVARQSLASQAREGVDAGRSGVAGDLQQSLHGHCGTDGRDVGQYRKLGEHQGTPGFLLRAVRYAGSADRQRASHARAPGVHG